MLTLPVPLKESAREGLLCELLDKRKQIDVHVDERKAVNAKIRPLQKDCGLIEGKLREGAEHRDIKCEVYELASNEVEIIRTDTRQVVERRTMTALERQGTWDWASAVQNKVDAAKAEAAAAAAAETETDDDDDESEGAPLDDDAGDDAPADAAPTPRARKRSKSKPASKSKSKRKSRSAAAHAPF